MKRRTTSKPAAPWEITESMFLSEDEADGLVNFLREFMSRTPPGEENRALVDDLIVEILLFSGLRNSELCQLKIADTEAGHGQPLLKITEPSHETRTVYLPRSLSRKIVSFVKGIRRELVLEGQDPDDTAQTLILNERGRPYDRTSLYRRVVRILTAAGLGERASVQLLRHTYGYLAYKRSNGNLLFVQKQLGHAHPMVTAVYAQFVKFSYTGLADVVGGHAFQAKEPSSKETSRQLHARKAIK